jgi:biotin operon repressor
MEVLRELELTSWGTYGMGRALAKKLGVSEATVSRDIQHLRAVRLDQGSEALKALAEFQPYFRESHR